MTKSQIFFYLLLAFIAGVSAASFVPPPVFVLWLIFSAGAAAVFFGALAGLGRKKAIVAGCVIMSFSFGAFWFVWSSSFTPSPFDDVINKKIEFSALVDKEPSRNSRTQRLVLRDAASGAKILAIVRSYPSYAYGDTLLISGRVERPENFSEDFDYVSYLAKDDIFYRVSFPDIKIISRGGGSRMYRALFALKSSFAAGLNRNLPEPHAAFIAGLILGERRSFPPELTEKLQITGTSHIVALSGYNITIVADAFMRALSFLFIPFSWAFGLAMLGIIFFTMLTGAQASVVRAAIMGILVLIARREGRLYRMRNALALAGAVMLFHNPKILRFDVAFQLSFLATLGLIYGAPIVEQYYQKIKLRLTPPARKLRLIKENRDHAGIAKKSFFHEIVVSTLAAQLFVLPLLVYHFGRLSLISPLANLAILPFIPSTMFFGFLTGSLAFLSDGLGRLAGLAAWIFLHYELLAVDFFSRLPFASLEINGFAFLFLIGLYALMGFWLLNRPKRRQ